MDWLPSASPDGRRGLPSFRIIMEPPPADPDGIWLLEKCACYQIETLRRYTNGSVIQHSHTYYFLCLCVIEREKEIYKIDLKTRLRVVDDWAQETFNDNYIENYYCCHHLKIKSESHTRPALSPERQLMLYNNHLKKHTAFLCPILKERGLVDIVMQYYPIE